jgi:methyl-accepting chemotaxis protein
MKYPMTTDLDDSPSTQRGMGLRAMLTTFAIAAVAATATVGAVALWSANQAGITARQTFVAKDVTADILPPPMYLLEMRLVLSQGAEGTLALDKVKAELKRLNSEYQARVKYWQDNPPFGLERTLLGAQHESALAFIAASAKVVEALEGKSNPATVQAALQAAQKAYMTHREGVDASVKESMAFAEASVASFDATATMEVRIQWALMVLAALSLAGLGVWIGRRVWAAVGCEPAEAAAMARAVALGDLSVRLPVAAGDGTSIVSALAQMGDSLSDIVRQVRASSDSIAVGSGEIAQGNNDLSARTEQQAAALEETAASMEELSSTVKQNADNAKQANQLALGASTVAVKGGEVVGQVVQTMKGINDSSKKIADIISVIDGIAFQTNILALNAAVEAARAGEQGRGFAVVASEVRSLAGRSADAAKEIKGLITASVERVEQGTALVDQAGATMTEVVAGIRRVTDIMGEISAASSEQSAGVAQVGEAITQMDQATQQNAALVEQSAAAAESLRLQARQLVQAVQVFQLGNGEATLAPAVEPAAAERRGPHRAKNVTRPKFKGKTETPAVSVAAKTGTDGEWASF